MLVAMEPQEWIVLMSAIVPAVLCVVVVIAVWRWSIRDQKRSGDTHL